MTITRRAFGTIATGLAATIALSKAGRAAPAMGMPAGAIDVHNHIMGPRDKYPYAADRIYTPPEASIADLRALRARIGVARNVLVLPSVYGFDNRCLVDALTELGNSARGIAVLPNDVPDAELKRFEASGVRGVRLNTGRGPQAVKDSLAAFGPRFVPLRWHVQIVGNLTTIPELAPTLAELKVPVVLDHFGGASWEGVNQPGFGVLLDLVRSRNIYVKLSAPYNRAKSTDYAEMTPLARALIAAAPDRMLWGTNWPHPDQVPGRPISEMSPYRKIDNEYLVRLFTEWCPDAAMRKMILVDTPERLYRFA